MRFQPGTFVKLNPASFTGTDNKSAPIWGGPLGFIGGMVKKTFTNDHEPKNHTALVEWTNLEKGAFREEELLPLSTTESEYSLEFHSSKGSMPRDIFVLLKMSSGRYALNVIESSASFTTPRPLAAYSAMLTKHALQAVDRPDVLLISEALSFPDITEQRSDRMFSAEVSVLRYWDIVAPRAIYHPLPTYKTLQEAAATSPASGAAPSGAYAFFHLPENLCDYGVSGPS